jgi:hypothetical protein
MKMKKKKKAAAVVESSASAVVKERHGKTIGVTSKLGVSDTWSMLFRQNAKKRLTDEQLLARMKKEFPRRKKFQPVGRVRNFYNRGVQGYGNPAGTNITKTKKSVPYDAKGRETKNSDWGKDRKKNPNMVKLARKRALKQWAARAGKKSKKAAAGKSSKKKPATVAKKKFKVKLKAAA